MAKNLQSKLPSTDTVSVFDVNAAAVDRLIAEMSANTTAEDARGARVKAARSAAEAADAVCTYALMSLQTSCTHMMNTDFPTAV